MSFIDDGIAKRQELKKRNDLIDEHGPKIYNDLWERMTRYFDEANEKHFKIFTNGSLFDRLVEIQLIRPNATSSHREKFRLVLDAKLRRITAIGDRGVHFTFLLDVCPDGIVCLKQNESRVENEDAVVMILTQFLFPELH